MESRCKNCIFWGEPVEGANYRKCSSPKIVRGYGDVDVPDDGANVEDDEGWGIMTGPDFGCIHFESSR
jgi:hypothetical protein